MIVSYYFPPRDEVGALRAAKLVKYLPMFGWSADVVTSGHGSPEQTELRADGGIVVRTRAGLGPRQAYLRLRALLGPSSRADRNDGDLTFVEKDQPAIGAFAGLIQTCRSLLWCPDDTIGWWWPAVHAARRLLRRQPYAAIVTTSPPPTTHLVGLALAGRCTNWIADFRDPWVNNPGKPRFVQSRLSERLDAVAERAVVRRARHIVVGTRSLHADLSARHPALGRRMAVIPAGVDGDDFATIRRELPDRFRVVHAGTMYYRRSPEPVFQAIAALLDRQQLPREDVEIVLAGRSADGINAPALAARYGLADVLRLPGQLPRARALELMASAATLLILAQDQPVQVPAKVFECLAAGPPIVAVTGAGETRDVLLAWGGERVACAEGGPALEAALLSAHRTWRDLYRSGRTTGLPVVPADLDRKQLTERFVALLEQRLT